MNRTVNILKAFENASLRKKAICPQMMGIDMDVITGGLSDMKSEDDIAKEQDKPVDDINEAVKSGQQIEMEHTDDGAQAQEIAKDHVDEAGPDYYNELGEMEETLEVDKEKGLGDPSPEDKEIIMRFLQTQADLDDETMHKLYISLGVDPHEGEEVVYAAAGESMGDDPAAAKEMAEAQEKEVEKDDKGEEDIMTEEMQAKPKDDEEGYNKQAVSTVDAVQTLADVLMKTAEAIPVADRKGTEKDDNQDNETVPTQIAKNSPENAPPKAVSAKDDRTEERKKEEEAQSNEKNEKVAFDKLASLKRIQAAFNPVPVKTVKVAEKTAVEQLSAIKDLSAKLGKTAATLPGKIKKNTAEVLPGEVKENTAEVLPGKVTSPAPKVLPRVLDGKSNKMKGYFSKVRGLYRGK